MLLFGKTTAWPVCVHVFLMPQTRRGCRCYQKQRHPLANELPLPDALNALWNAVVFRDSQESVAPEDGVELLAHDAKA